MTTATSKPTKRTRTKQGNNRATAQEIARIRESLYDAAQKLDPSSSHAHVDAVIERFLHDIKRKKPKDERKVSLLKRLGKFLLHETYRNALLAHLVTGKIVSKTGIIATLIALVFSIVSQGGDPRHVLVYAAVIVTLIGETVRYWSDVELTKLKARNVSTAEKYRDRKH